MASPAADKEEAETEKANNAYIKKSTGWDGIITNHCCSFTLVRKTQSTRLTKYSYSAESTTWHSHRWSCGMQYAVCNAYALGGR